MLGAASFCALGVAVATLIRNSEAAPPVVQLVLFPLVFISGTYMQIHSAALNRVAGLRRCGRSTRRCSARSPTTPGSTGSSLGVLLAWGVAGAVVAIRRFRWGSPTGMRQAPGPASPGSA